MTLQTPTQTAPSLEPRLDFSEDPNLPELARLFDRDWVWAGFRKQSRVEASEPPLHFRVRQFVHRPGRTAFARYETRWPSDAYLPPQHFVARLDKGAPPEFFLYPDDARLPGLPDVADPARALKLVNTHVLVVPARRARVQLITYRPGYRAVVRHRIGRIKLYARVVRPIELPRMLDAYEIMRSSGFVLPSLAGYWEEGGVLWFSEVKGRNLRRAIRKGKRPDPTPILAGLERLWKSPSGDRAGRPMRLDVGYRSARRSFRHHLRDCHSGLQILNDAIDSLDPFVRAWQPTDTAHNDFYDDQLIQLQDGKIALVDFEEAGPGEPMLDVGNFLAHLRWSSKFGRAKSAAECRHYYKRFRNAALERFAWDDRDISIREAICLFRICTNFIRHPQANWREKLESGLTMVNDILN